MLEQLITADDLLSRKLLVMVNTIGGTYTNLLDVHKSMWAEIWFDQNIPPAAFLQKLGAQGAMVTFQLSNEIIETINKAGQILGKPPYIPEVPYEYTMDPAAGIVLGNLKAGYITNPNGTIRPAPPPPPGSTVQSEEQQWQETMAAWDDASPPPPASFTPPSENTGPAFGGQSDTQE